MERSYQARDFDELVNLAHWLRGSAGTVGFEGFTEPAETLKYLAAERKGSEIEAAIRELRSLSEAIQASRGRQARSESED